MPVHVRNVGRHTVVKEVTSREREKALLGSWCGHAKFWAHRHDRRVSAAVWKVDGQAGGRRRFTGRRA